MDKFLFALAGLFLGFGLGWFTFSPKTVATEEVAVEEAAPANPAEPVAETATPTPVEEVPLPPQETVEPAPTKAK